MNIENELIIYSLKGGCCMTNWQIVNHRLQNLSLHNLKEICYAHNISMEERDLELILQIIKNNPYSIVNEEYTPILFIEISNVTNKATCDKFKPIIEKEYLIH